MPAINKYCLREGYAIFSQVFLDPFLENSPESRRGFRDLPPIVFLPRSSCCQVSRRLRLNRICAFPPSMPREGVCSVCRVLLPVGILDFARLRSQCPQNAACRFFPTLQLESFLNDPLKWNPTRSRGLLPTRFAAGTCLGFPWEFS